MKEFLFVFRTDKGGMPKGSDEEMQAMTKRWMDWIGGIAAQNKLKDKGNRLQVTGKVVQADNLVTDGPYTEIKESIGGYTLVKATTIEEAADMAKDCPILSVGGNVEVREINPM